METLFTPRQFVRCIDSKGEFSNGAKWPLIEGKRYQVKNNDCWNYVSKAGIVGIELYMVDGVFDQNRFIAEQEYNELENEIFNLMKH